MNQIARLILLNDRTEEAAPKARTGCRKSLVRFDLGNLCHVRDSADRFHLVCGDVLDAGLHGGADSYCPPLILTNEDFLESVRLSGNNDGIAFFSMPIYSAQIHGYSLPAWFRQVCSYV
jgi:hypothetical protein